MTIRNRGHQVVKRLRDEHGVTVTVTRDGSLLLAAMDSRGVSVDATRLARVFKQRIVNELMRRGSACNASA